MRSTPSISIAEGDIADNLRSYVRHLRAGNVSPRTVQTYSEAVEQLAAFLLSKGMPSDVAKIRREHVEAFIDDLLHRQRSDGTTYKPSTAHNRYRGAKAFFGWLVDEGEIKSSPMERMKPPRLPEQPVPVLSETELRSFLKTVDAGRTFDERRDAAILRVFISTGARLAEVAGLRYTPGNDETNDLDLDHGIVRVLGKGGRQRIADLNPKAVKAIDRYIRARSKHPQASLPWLWIGRKGRFGESGIGQMVADRGREASISGRVHPHQLRHTVVHRELSRGLQETSAMRLFGWRSREMLARYAASTGTERALAEQRRLRIGDDL